MKKGIVFIVCLFFFSTIQNTYADTEFSGSLYVGWSNLPSMLPISLGMNFNVGYTTASIVDRVRYDGYSYIFTGTSKDTSKNDYDIFFSVNAVFPFMQAGGMFNYYITSNTFALLHGFGIGLGYAMGFFDDGKTSNNIDNEEIKHGPYIRIALPILLSSIGLTFDYYLFDKFQSHYIQVGLYITFFYF